MKINIFPSSHHWSNSSSFKKDAINFIGVYSVDTVPKNLWKKCCCSIINLSEAHETGSHFIAVYINKQNDLWYFDSYALPLPIHNYHLMIFFRKMDKMWKN